MDMLLQRGSTGDHVKRVQQKLGLLADGNFGPKTEANLRKWQIDNGLSPTGVVDSIVWNRMFDTSTNSVGHSQFGDKLRGYIPQNVVMLLDETVNRFSINTPLRLAHFLAQISHESGEFKVVYENLNYSSSGLRRVFSKYFPTEQLAIQYQRKPEAIANRVYANRMNNGNEASGDGWKFRGRGYIQCTGKFNYTLFSQSVNDPQVLVNPDLVATRYPMLSAGWFWDRGRLNTIADRGNTEAVVRQITKAVNGGFNGIEHRLSEFNKFYTILTK
jgi:putative chitinase